MDGTIRSDRPMTSIIGVLARSRPARCQGSHFYFDALASVPLQCYMGVIDNPEAKPETRFSELASLCEGLTKTTKRKKKVSMISEFLGDLRQDEVGPAVLLITGFIFPESERKPLEISYASLSKLQKKPAQTTLFEKPLTIRQVRDYFERIAHATGKGSRETKERLLSSLLHKTNYLESKYIVKNIFGEMQIGVVEGLMIESIAEASGATIDEVRRASMFLGNLGEVAEIAVNKGPKYIRKVTMSLFKPVKPMLAEMAYSVEEVFHELQGDVSFEYKFDGARVQIHKRGKHVRIFTRRLTEVTESLTELAELVRKDVSPESVILDGEVIALDKTGKPLPFQELMRRFKRKKEVELLRTKIPLKLYVFDILYLDDACLIDLPYSERWNRLEKSRGSLASAPRIITSSVQEADAFMSQAISEGHEGLVAKALESTYSPGMRGKKWFKIKSAYYLDLVIVGAEWGYGRRTGWLSDYYLAAYDPEGEGFQIIGKTFKGLTDQEFKQMTSRLLQIKTSGEEHAVWVRPEIVVEVAYSEIQRSPHYKSGFALRFARITRIRDDKGPTDADTIEKVRELFQKQFLHKGSIPEE